MVESEKVTSRLWFEASSEQAAQEVLFVEVLDFVHQFRLFQKVEGEISHLWAGRTKGPNHRLRKVRISAIRQVGDEQVGIESVGLLQLFKQLA